MIELTVSAPIAVLGLAALAVFAGIWTYRLRHGVPFHPLGEAVLVLGYLALFFLVESGSWTGVASTAPLDLAVLGGAIAVGAVYTFRTSRVLRWPTGQIGYRGRAGIPAAWILLLGLDVLVQVVGLGQVTVLHYLVLQGIPAPGGDLGSGIANPAGMAQQVADGLFAASTGLLIGQSFGVEARVTRWAVYQRSSVRGSPAVR
ncbi:MAG: hypothetical protein L3K08_03215 [Thermoplasmata archaeon]|nr:hypothetical protein [Thermoplasmata archaeon]